MSRVRLPGGRRTAVVGVSGSGKSMVHMLLRHFDPMPAKSPSTVRLPPASIQMTSVLPSPK
ncbi:MAG: hypothetical protein U1U88_001999 [Lawsonella clevelandensis]